MRTAAGPKRCRGCEHGYFGGKVCPNCGGLNSIRTAPIKANKNYKTRYTDPDPTSYYSEFGEEDTIRKDDPWPSVVRD